MKNLAVTTMEMRMMLLRITRTRQISKKVSQVSILLFAVFVILHYIKSIYSYMTVDLLLFFMQKLHQRRLRRKNRKSNRKLRKTLSWMHFLEILEQIHQSKQIKVIIRIKKRNSRQLVVMMQTNPRIKRRRRSKKRKKKLKRSRRKKSRKNRFQILRLLPRLLLQRRIKTKIRDNRMLVRIWQLR